MIDSPFLAPRERGDLAHLCEQHASSHRRLHPAPPAQHAGAGLLLVWANQAEVAELRSRLDGPTWEGIALIMRDDGVVGSRGQPPTANAVRRVWGRVRREIEAREARKAERGS